MPSYSQFRGVTSLAFHVATIKANKPMYRLKEYLAGWFSNRNRAIWTASILAVVIRLGTSVALETYKFNPARDHWAFGYEWGRIAKWLVAIKMFSLDGSTPTSDTDPLYVFLIAPFFYVFGTFTTGAAIALIVFQSVLCALGTWAIFALAEKVYGPFEARLSALLFALYPASIYLAVGRIGPSSLKVLLLCLLFMVVITLRESSRTGSAILAGFLMGLSILTSSKVLSLFLIVPLWLFFAGKEQRGRMVLLSAIVIGTATLVMLPWSVRNSIVIGEASFTKTNIGYHIWAGNNPGATGYFYTSRIDEDPLRGEKGGTALEEGKGPQYLERAFSWVAKNPTDFLVLTLRRMKYFWYQIPRAEKSRADILHAWTFMAVLGLALVGVLWPGERSRNVWLLILFFATFPLIFYLTHVTFYRHRYHIEPFLLILSSRGICGLWSRTKMNAYIPARWIEKRNVGL